MTSLSINYGVTPTFGTNKNLKAQRGQRTNAYQTSFGKTSNNEPPKKSALTTLLATGITLAIAAGLYVLTRGKTKVNECVSNNVTERLLSEGRKLSREIVKNEDGTQSTIFKLVDSEGNLIKQKVKTIIRSTNPINGKKYITKKDEYTAPGSFFAEGLSADKKATVIFSRYYDKSGKPLFKTRDVEAKTHIKDRYLYSRPEEETHTIIGLKTGNRKYRVSHLHDNNNFKQVDFNSKGTLRPE